ncbi:MAG TPA: CHAP domain-containing protein, partial [Propionicimonas sp.]|nr:CHAP domain-containing protein [Propionicimonas sp.]
MVLALAISLAMLYSIGVASAQAVTYFPAICQGYSGCNESNNGNGGYQFASSTSYWNQYPNHNCTNYAAYRAIRNGAPQNLGYSLGGAETWGPIAEQHGVSVDNSPTVGSIAWFSWGHVAYVEAIEGDKVVVSEDNYSDADGNVPGDFDWRRYYISDVTKFIHFTTATTAPDADNDGTPDSADKCPTVAGPGSTNGCPDFDGDSVADEEDPCRSAAGPVAYEGCPVEAVDVESNRPRVDFNNDGKADYCRVIGGVPGYRIQCTVSTGTGFGTTYTSTTTDPGYDLGRTWTDFNNDGKADYCRVTGGGSDYRIQCTVSTGTGFGTTYT